MNDFSLKLDYSKTLNEQVETINFYKKMFADYIIENTELSRENKKLKEQQQNFIKKLEERGKYFDNCNQPNASEIIAGIKEMYLNEQK